MPLREQGLGRATATPAEALACAAMPDWKKVWNEAVENFYRELGEDEDGGPARTRAMRRELDAARHEVERLEAETADAARGAAEERAEEAVCQRRRAQAERIEDAETVRLAIAWAIRHARRAAVLDRKTEVLRAELELRRADLAEMEEALGALSSGEDAATGSMGSGPVDESSRGTGPASGGSAGEDRTGAPGGGPPPRDLFEEERLRQEREREFRRLDREARERAAEARLEELKRKMR